MVPMIKTQTGKTNHRVVNIIKIQPLKTIIGKINLPQLSS